MSLPTDDKARKALPLWTFLTEYFLDAWLAVARVAIAGNEQHNPGEPLHWAREKSTDQMNTAFRHLLDYAKGVEFDTDGQYHLAKAIWRLSAQLQLDIEKEASQEAPGEAIDSWPSQSYPPQVESVAQLGGIQDGSVRQYKEGCNAPRSGEGAWIPHYRPGYIQGSGQGATWCQEGEFCQDGEAPLQAAGGVLLTSSHWEVPLTSKSAGPRVDSTFHHVADIWGTV